MGNRAETGSGPTQSESGSNEIEAIPHLLEKLLLKGCIVTIDAMGCQTDIAEAIQEAGADYILRMKDNQSGLRADIERVFDRCRELGARPGTTDVDGGNGRIETCHCWAMGVGGRGLIDIDRWADACSIALIETERFETDPSAESGAEAGSVDGETTFERRYVLSSLPPDATQLLEATRRHWRIENGLHWSLGVAFGEDDSQVHSGNAAGNLGRVRRLALSMLKQDEQHRGRSGRGAQSPVHGDFCPVCNTTTGFSPSTSASSIEGKKRKLL